MPRLRLSIVFALLCLLVAAPAASALEDQAAPPTVPTTAPTVFSPDRVIVQWLPAADRGDRVEARADADVSFQSDLGNRDFQLVAVEPGQTAAAAVQDLRADPAVAVAERDSYSSLDAVPNDALFTQLWGLRNLGFGIDGFAGALPGIDIAAPVAWDRAVGTPSTVIADIDSGYRFEHPDLGPVAWTNPGEVSNGVDDDGNGLVDDLHGADYIGANGEAPSGDGDPTDDDLISGGHGVHTAGTLGAAGNNGVGISGVSRNVRIMPLRACSRYPAEAKNLCDTAAQVAAINYAGQKGARAANMSLGGATFRQTVVNAIAANPKVLFVISAGNDGTNNDATTHHYPCDYRPTADASPPVPGAIENIICVAATDQADGLAAFSNYGATSVDLGAPGTETLSTYPFPEYLKDRFTVNDFAARWPATGVSGGFQRTSEAPLGSFGITDVVGAPVANTVREVTSTPVTIPASAGCKLSQTRRVVLAAGAEYRYSVLLNGAERSAVVAAGTPGPGLENRFTDLPAAFNAGGKVQVRFRFSAGPAPGASGVWLDNIELSCTDAVGQSAGYAFLQGTSMATPHVTGAAGLLFSLKPTATVTQVRNALLSTTDPVSSLSGETVTGGRLDVAAALNALVPPGTETERPETAILSGPASTTTSTVASFAFARADADAGTFECHLDAAAWSACISPKGYTVGLGAHQFQVRAKNAAGLIDLTPATGSWTVVPVPPVPPVVAPACKVPKLVGKTLGQAKAKLKGAGCKLGKVTKPRRKKGRKAPKLVVKSSAPRAGATAADSVVSLHLGKKPKSKKKHRH